MTNTIELVQAIAGVATAIGILLAGWQLVLTKRIAATQFEDQLAAQYREIIRRLPVEAMLGEELSEKLHGEALQHFYHYFDLSNEQAFLFKARRIRRHTWTEWKEGIEENLARKAFDRAWKEVSARAPTSFNDLRSVIAITTHSPPRTHRS